MTALVGMAVASDYRRPLQDQTLSVLRGGRETTNNGRVGAAARGSCRKSVLAATRFILPSITFGGTWETGCRNPRGHTTWGWTTDRSGDTGQGHIGCRTASPPVLAKGMAPWFMRCTSNRRDQGGGERVWDDEACNLVGT